LIFEVSIKKEKINRARGREGTISTNECTANQQSEVNDQLDDHLDPARPAFIHSSEIALIHRLADNMVDLFCCCEANLFTANGLSAIEL